MNERLSEAHRNLESAVARLLEAIQLPENAILRDAAIQRFEFSFELLWKCLRLYLEYQGLASGGPRDTLRRSFSAGVVESEMEADLLIEMLEDRNLSTHAYDEELAIRIYQRIVSRHGALLERMSLRLKDLLPK